MFGRLLIYLTLTVSLIWIGWSGYELLNENNNYQPEKLFGLSDQSILIINRPDEIKLELINEYDNSPAKSILESIPVGLYKKAYLSKSRDHLLIQGNTNWSEESISEALKSLSDKLSFDTHFFKTGEYSGRFHKTNLYIYKLDIKPGESGIKEFNYDKNASAAEFTFQSDSHYSVRDIYIKKDGKIDFISHTDDYTGKQVRDEEIFAYQVTANFDSYHFLERTYFASIDKTFKKSPMNKWLMYGFLELTYDGETVLISDFIEGQEPDLILKELNQNADVDHYSVPLTGTFPRNGKTYTVKYLEDLAIFSENPDISDRIISDFKLGKTIALTPTIKQKVYGKLPKRVSERYIDTQYSNTKTIYHGKLIETRPSSAEIKQTVVKDQSQLSYACNFTPIDFVLSENGNNIIALGSNGELAGFKNQKRTWLKKLEGKILGSLSLIDLYNNGELYVMVNTSDEIHLLDMEGNYSSGFPVKLENPAINPVKFYRWKEKSHFIIEDQKQQLVLYNGKGNELNIFKTNIPADKQIDIWASKGKLFAGIGNQSQFEMIELDRGKKYREFGIPTNSRTIKTTNELFHFAIENNKLIRIDQKGQKTVLGNYPNGEIIDITSDNHNITIKIRANNILHLLNGEGIEISKIEMPFAELASNWMNTNHSGNTLIALIDGLENNVYLYHLNGKKVDGGSFEGETKVVIANQNDGQFVFTIVDQFIVRYSLK